MTEVMKKIYFAMAVLGTVLLSSCVQEKNFKDITVGENEIAFVMQGVSTRSAEEGSPLAIQGISIPMGVMQGEALYLEETIEELNPSSPTTRGVPVYTVNLPTVYPTMGVYAAAGEFGDAVFDKMDTEQYDNDGWRYNHNYGKDPWPDDETTVNFYLRMPVSGGGVSNYSATTFEFTSPANGKQQQDILFGQVSINKLQHDKALPGGYPVTMKHALTGIKFRNGHLNGTQTKTIITKVELIGLNTYGKGTVGADGVVTWSDVETPSTATAPFYLVFDNPTYDPDLGATNVDGTIGASDWASNLQNTTWDAAAADHNLNHANGELTFWFIPQEVPDDLILNIEFYVKTPDSPDGQLVPHTVKLGELLNTKYRSVEGNAEKNLKWEAGQLRTYTLKPYDVDVEIKDVISEAVKEKLHVANTGNVDEYVRMLVMGNWYGWKPGTTADQMNPNSTSYVQPSIIVGYKYKDADAVAAAIAAGVKDASIDDMVEPWFRGGYKVVTGYGADNKPIYQTTGEVDSDGNPIYVYQDPYGKFDSTFTLGSLGKTSNESDRDGKKDDWADASGGYYYTSPIGPGDGVNSAQSATKDLFKSYTVTKVPDMYLPVGATREKAVGVHLVMEIVIQAIAVPTEVVDGVTKNVWWLQAWYNATGIDKLNPTAERNADYVALYEDGEYD